VRGSERNKEAVEQGGAMVPGHRDNLKKNCPKPKNIESNLIKPESCLRRDSVTVSQASGLVPVAETKQASFFFNRGL